MNRPRGSMAVLAMMGVALISFDLIGLAAGAPRVASWLESPQGRALLMAGRVAVRGASEAVVDGVSQAAISVAISAVKQTTEIYAAVLALTPGAGARGACPLECRQASFRRVIVMKRVPRPI